MRLWLAVAALLLVACGDVKIRPEATLPKPLIVQLPAAVGLIIPPETRRFTDKETRFGLDWTVDLGPGEVRLLQEAQPLLSKVLQITQQLGIDRQLRSALYAQGTHLLGDARFAPIYDEAQRLDVMLAIHASGSHLGGAGVDLFPRFIQAHTVSHPFGQMRQLTSMIFEGIPERFPALRLAFLEAGAGWAPYWMERMDDEYAKRSAEAPALRKKPSEYVRGGNIYFSCEADEWLLPQAMKLVGDNQIVFASDRDRTRAPMRSGLSRAKEPPSPQLGAPSGVSDLTIS